MEELAYEMLVNKRKFTKKTDDSSAMVKNNVSQLFKKHSELLNKSLSVLSDTEAIASLKELDDLMISFYRNVELNNQS